MLDIGPFPAPQKGEEFITENIKIDTCLLQKW